MKFVIESARSLAAGQGAAACRGRIAPARRGAAAGLALGLALLAGCSAGGPGAGEPSAAAPVAAADAAAPLPPALDELDAGGLRDRAARALREQRIHTPAGDSAVDYYLALREKAAGQADVAAALTELQPYVVIAGEQALADGDLAESQRLTELLARMDPQAPALPRLRGAQAEHERQAREQAERLAGERADAAAQARVQAAQRSAAANAALKAQASASAAAADEAAARASTPAAPIPGAATASANPASPAGPPPAAAATGPAAPAAAPPPAASRPAARPAPRLLADAAPRYPAVAVARKLEGRVDVAFTILPDGSTGAARVLSSQPAGVFDEAALSAVARLRFEASGQSHPAQRTLNFRLPKR